MSETFWMLLIGVPVIVWLLVRAVQRVQRLRDRIADVQDEMARNPQSPYEALADLFQQGPEKSQEHTRDKRPH